MSIEATSAAPVALFKKRKQTSLQRNNKATAKHAREVAADSSDDSDTGVVGKRSKKQNITGRQTSIDAAGISGVKHSAEDISSSALPRRSNQTNQATLENREWTDEDLMGKKTTNPPPSEGYTGQKNYQKFEEARRDVPTQNKYTQIGPIRAAANVRTVTVVDYQPDVCKDYKQTGYCGFGDNCKFLHDRGDYKAGWQLDREWEIEQAKKKAGHKTGSDDEQEDDDEEEEIPFNCVIHRGPYVEPVVTLCGHYFCESCAIKRYKKTPSCFVCGAGTGGVFNKARKLIDMLKKKEAAEEEANV